MQALQGLGDPRVETNLDRRGQLGRKRLLDERVNEPVISVAVIDLLDQLGGDRFVDGVHDLPRVAGKSHLVERRSGQGQELFEGELAADHRADGEDAATHYCQVVETPSDDLADPSGDSITKDGLGVDCVGMQDTLLLQEPDQFRDEERVALSVEVDQLGEAPVCVGATGLSNIVSNVAGGQAS